MYKKILIIFLVLLISGCNLQNNNEALLPKENQLLDYITTEDDLDSVNRIEVLDIRGSLDSDNKKIITDDEAKEIVNLVSIMKVLNVVDENDVSPGGILHFIFYSEDKLVFEFSLLENNKYVRNSKDKLFEVSRGKALYELYVNSKAEILKIPVQDNE